MMAGNGSQLSVPPGFRFHPTDEELLYYYLRKKVSYEAIDLDVIREVDLNKLEPWDLKEKCRIGSAPQNDWYFFSHKDKKYPTGTRTNRATAAGFWKATGRDKAIHLGNSKRIGMRKTLVFYTGRAPHGQKTDWIMHEYRLDDDQTALQQEDGWVVCRVFKKKSHSRGFPEMGEEEQLGYNKASTASVLEPKHNFEAGPYECNNFDGSLCMHLPQLLSPESTHHHHQHVTPPSFLSPVNNSFINPPFNTTDIECSQNLLRLQQERFPAAGDWSFLDKLLASHQNLQDQNKCHEEGPSASVPRFSFHHLGCDLSDFSKFSK
ncbi:hypothetical protein NMG60_11034613 [Bertholletia excelsa]